MKNLECSNCVIASSQNSNSFLERFDRMDPWRRRRNFKPMKLQNSLVGTKAFIKDSLRQCARLVKAFGTKLLNGRCGFSVVCAAREYTLVSSSTKAVKLNRFHLFFTYISTSFSSSETGKFKFKFKFISQQITGHSSLH